ncbi:MAG: PIN domain-containing protein [Thermomicrobiales bacterium]
MIVLDANVVLRYFVRPATPEDEQTARIARSLFRLVREGQETFTTSDAVIAEVVFILSSKRHYNVPRPEVGDLVRPILQVPGCKVPRKRLSIQALDLWVSRPKLSFVDALVVVWAEELGESLASFDAQVNRMPGIDHWQPPDTDSDAVR